MVKIHVNIETSGNNINWLSLSGKQHTNASSKEKGKSRNGHLSDEEAQNAVDDKIAATGRKKDIYGSIIAKWVNISQQGGQGDVEGSEEEFASDDAYEPDDRLIDDSELQEKFTRRAKSMKVSESEDKSGSDDGDEDGDGGDDEEEEMDQDEFEEKDEQHPDDGAQGEAQGGAGGMNKPRRKRKAREMKGAEGSIDPFSVPQVVAEIEAFKKCAGPILGGGGGSGSGSGGGAENAKESRKTLPKPLEEPLVKLYHVARLHNCTLSKLWTHLADVTQLKPKTIAERARKGFEMRELSHKESLDLQLLSVNLDYLRKANAPIVIGEESEPGTFAAFYHDLLETVKAKSTPSQLRKSLGNFLKTTIHPILKCLQGCDETLVYVNTKTRSFLGQNGGNEAMMLAMDDDIVDANKKRSNGPELNNFLDKARQTNIKPNVGPNGLLWPSAHKSDMPLLEAPKPRAGGKGHDSAAADHSRDLPPPKKPFLGDEFDPIPEHDKWTIELPRVSNPVLPANPSAAISAARATQPQASQSSQPQIVVLND